MGFKSIKQKYQNNILGLNMKDGVISVPLPCWIIVCAVLAVLFSMHTYNDLLITAKQGCNFWNCLFEGRFRYFYEDSVLITGNKYYPVEQGAGYSILIYIVFAVWNFPIWAIEKVFHTNAFNTIPAMIWMKLMLVPFLGVSCKYISKILNQFEDKKKYSQLAAFMFLSSIITIYCTAIIGQYDIIAVALSLIGIYAWNSNKTKQFLIAFMFASFFKYFAILYFLPLLLLKEKKLIKIALKTVLVISPSFLINLIFVKVSSNVDNLYGIFLKGIPLDNGKLMLFPLIFAIVLIICYLSNIEDGEMLRFATYNFMVVFGAFCILIEPFPYWCILIVPVLILSVFMSYNNTCKLFLLETALSVGIMVKNWMLYYWCFGVKTVLGMGLMNRILGIDDSTLNVSDYLEFHGMLYSFVITALVGIWIIILYLSSKKSKNYDRLEPINNGWIYLRTAINLIVGIAPLTYSTLQILNVI